MLQSRCFDRELEKEVMMNRIKTLEDQNKQQFRQIGKLEGSVNTLTTLVKDIFKKNITTVELNEVQPNESFVEELNGEETISPIIPTSNKFNPLEDNNVDLETNETETTSAFCNPLTYSSIIASLKDFKGFLMPSRWHSQCVLSEKMLLQRPPIGPSSLLESFGRTYEAVPQICLS